MFCASLVLAAILTTGASAVAPKQKATVPENFANMSIEQRVQWIDENVPAEYREGVRVNNVQRGSQETFYGEAEERVEDGAGGVLARFVSTVEWTVNSSAPNAVQSFDVTGTRVYNYMSGGISKVQPVESYYVNQGNVKVILQGEAYAPYVDYIMVHDYNLHYGGNYSLRTFHYSL